MNLKIVALLFASVAFAAEKPAPHFQGFDWEWTLTAQQRIRVAPEKTVQVNDVMRWIEAAERKHGPCEATRYLRRAAKRAADE